MRKFLTLSIIFVSIIFLLSLFVDYKVSHYLRYNDDRRFKAWGDIYNYKQNNDIVINGSSRAWVQYNPEIIDSILHVNSYNLGIDGSCINRQILKYYAFCKIQNNHPDLLIQNIDFITMDITFGYEREQFFPMFLYDRSLMNKFSEYEKLNVFEKYCPCYRYWGYPELVQSAFGLNELWYGDTLSKGYYGRNINWEGIELSKIKTLKYAKDSIALAKFCKFISDVTTSGTKVIFVYAPIYIEATNKIVNIKGMYEMYDTIAKKYNIPILDYNYDPICYDTAYFYNASHMNRKGAEMFTTKLAHDIDSLGILK